MKNITDCLDEVMSSMSGEHGKLARIASNNAIFIKAVSSIWKDDEASNLILSHVNAFYVRMDSKAKIGIPLGQEYAVCEVCVDDPLVRSEIDTHREILSAVIQAEGLDFEELRIISARGDMRKRHPFKAN